VDDNKFIKFWLFAVPPLVDLAPSVRSVEGIDAINILAVDSGTLLFLYMFHHFFLLFL
jgi:hypothetical protein